MQSHRYDRHARGPNQTAPPVILVLVTNLQVSSAPAVAMETQGGLELSTFEDFYAETYRDLTAYCWQLVRDVELSHDMAQECFTRLLGRWIKVREPRAYLFHIATNLARETWRSQARSTATVESLAAQPSVHHPGDPASAMTVQAAVDRLPRRYREVVLLYYYADLPLATVAAAVRRPAGTVKRQLSEARALLAGDLEDTDD